MCWDFGRMGENSDLTPCPLVYDRNSNTTQAQHAHTQSDAMRHTATFREIATQLTKEIRCRNRK